ncbi:hypothetical protein F0562_033912 [Nyssa sinensis]|uniref:WIT1/2 N-terminal helical bundle domain-containing protein n=1 Tax=Nyssa sinensis TaxID=561372 RepID=A0A5J5AGE5_9ASTE|nr:hypothetical protein F0562_033912 [Nyssa sinensis]
MSGGEPKPRRKDITRTFTGCLEISGSCMHPRLIFSKVASQNKRIIGMDSAYNVVAGDPELGKIYRHEDGTYDSKDVGEIRSAMELLTRVDIDLAYSSEKLVNLDTLLMHVLAWENDFEAMAMEDDNILEELFEKALVFDLLSGILDSEVRELENFMGTLQPVIVCAHQKISSSRHLRELFILMEDKLHDSEESLKKSQEEVLDIKMHLAKLERTLLTFKHSEWKYDRGMDLSEKVKLQMSMQSRKSRLLNNNDIF